MASQELKVSSAARGPGKAHIPKSVEAADRDALIRCIRVVVMRMLSWVPLVLTLV